ncbi:MAG: FHA domain-containing protein [Ruegeria sp.]
MKFIRDIISEKRAQASEGMPPATEARDTAYVLTQDAAVKPTEPALAVAEDTWIEDEPHSLSQDLSDEPVLVDMMQNSAADDAGDADDVAADGFDFADMRTGTERDDLARSVADVIAEEEQALDELDAWDDTSSEANLFLEDDVEGAEDEVFVSEDISDVSAAVDQPSDIEAAAEADVYELDEDVEPVAPSPVSAMPLPPIKPTKPPMPKPAESTAQADAVAPSAQPVKETVAAPNGPGSVDVPAPAAGRGNRRAGRVKTRLLGFNSAGTAADPFTARAEGAPSAEFPVGWLVVVDGPGRGSAFTLFDGVAQIGRGEGQSVRLDFGDTSISRENHAAIAYDTEQHKFFLGHGGKANLVRLNDRPVLSTEELSDGNRIRIGETTLLFKALCGDGFDWSAGKGKQGDLKHVSFG